MADVNLHVTVAPDDLELDVVLAEDPKTLAVESGEIVVINTEAVRVTATTQADGVLLSVRDHWGTTTGLVLNGEKGEKGDTGATGAQGEKGDRGPQGPTGPAGTTDYNDLINKPLIPSNYTDVNAQQKPLEGSTATLTPLDVAAALENGRDVYMTVSETFLAFPEVFTLAMGIYAHNVAKAVVGCGIINIPLGLYAVQLMGDVDNNSWSWTVTELAPATAIPNALSQLTNDTGYVTAAGTVAEAKLAAGIPYAAVDPTSTSTAFTASVDGITEYKDGVCVMLRNGVTTSAAGFTIDINGLGPKPVYSSLAAASQSSTIFNTAYTMLFVYDEDRVAGGCWVVYYGYDSNTNTIGYQIRTNSQSLPMDSITYRYRLFFKSVDGLHFVPANNSTSTNATAKRNTIQTPIDPFGQIFYYGTTASVSAGSRPSTSYLWQQYNVTLGYSFNRTGAALALTAYSPVYIKAAPQVGGGAIIEAETPYVQALPSNADGYIYIYLGIATGATTVELELNHPVYYHDGTRIRLWT